MEVAPGRRARCWVTADGRPLPPPPVAAEAAARAPEPGAPPLLAPTGLVKHFPGARNSFLGPHAVVTR